MNKYLSKEESTAIKGLLIFIIILGHNAIITNSVKNIMPYVYLFHVKAFFILPFFYKSRTISFKDCALKNFIRLYYPFLLLFIILSLLYYFVSSNIVDPNKIAKGLDTISDNPLLYFTNTLFTGNAYLIDYFTGYQFLWFLPVMFSLMIIKNYLQDRKIIRYIALFIGFILYFVMYSYSKAQSIQELRFNMMLFSPFAIIQGIAMYFMGYTCSQIILNDKVCQYLAKCFSAIFIIFSIFVLYKLNQNPDFVKTCEYGSIIRFIAPFLFMGLLYTLRKLLSRSTILIKLGELSLPIYIFSTLICTIFYMIFNRLNAITPSNGIIAQILITIISYYVALLLYRMPTIRKWIFPRSKEEIYISRAEPTKN